MGSKLKVRDWYKLGLKVEGKWGDASHTRNSDRQSHTDLKPDGTYAKYVVWKYQDWSDTELMDAAMSNVLFSKYGPKLAENFKSKSGKKISFTIDKWIGLGSSKGPLIKAISEKLKGFHEKFHLPPSGEALVVNINDEIRTNLPSFGFAPIDLSEMIAIGGIQEVTITSENPSQSFGWDYWDKDGNIHNEPHFLRLKLKFLFRDWFGVDEGDFASWVKPTAWLDEKGLACFWILQHQRGYPPFITEWTYEQAIAIPLGNL